MSDPQPSKQEQEDTQQFRPPGLQQIVDDIVAFVLRETGSYPAGQKSLEPLARLQPDGPWQRMLDFIEHERLNGIQRKIQDGRATQAEIEDHNANRPDNAQAIAAHRNDDAQRNAGPKGGA